MADILNGSAFVAGKYNEEGEFLASGIVGLLTSLIVNGVDFGVLLAKGITYNKSWYYIQNKDKDFWFSFYFDEDFSNYKKGKRIPFNLFEIETYIQNIDISLD